jgi:hypothetical protein
MDEATGTNQALQQTTGEKTDRLLFSFGGLAAPSGCAQYKHCSAAVSLPYSM